MEMIKVLLIEPNILMRAAIKNLLLEYGKYHIVGETVSGQDAMLILKQYEVNVAIVNVDDLDGVTCINAISGLYPGTKAIALSNNHETSQISPVMAAGAKAYLLIEDVEDELFLAIKTVMVERVFYCDKLKHKQWEVSRANKKGKAKKEQKQKELLTAREKEVLHLIFKQCTNEEIAQKLQISIRTVNTHKRNMLEKAGAKNMAGLLIYAINNKVFNINVLA